MVVLDISANDSTLFLASVVTTDLLDRKTTLSFVSTHKEDRGISHSPAFK